MDSQHSNALKPKKNIKVVVTRSNLERVKEITQSMTKEARAEFAKKYGKILDLLAISVSTPALSALAQFWKSSVRCFELPNLDAVPTIEEYATMLGLPVKEEVGVYIYKGQYVEDKKVIKMIGMGSNQVKLEKKGLIYGFKRTALETHLEALAKRGDWVHFNKTLALIIYGLVLFPFAEDVIDQAAMDVFYQFEEQRSSPIPAIVAETLLSLEVCHQRGGGSLRCCSHVLYVWFMTHVYAASHMGTFPDPLRDFHRVPTKQLEAPEWREEFASIEVNRFMWTCPWYHPKSIIISCGEFPNVPLMGPRGCVAYTPAIALRQLKWTQVRPNEGQLGGVSFQYDKMNTVKQQSKVRAAWRSIHKIGEKELGKPKIAASAEYKEWRMARGICIEGSRATNHDASSSQGASIPQLELMKTHLRSLEEEKEKGEVQAERLKRKVQRMEKEIEHLQDECADAYESQGLIKRLRGGRVEAPERVTPNLEEMQKKIAEQERVLTEMGKESEQLRKEISVQKQRMEFLQQDLSEAHLRADRGWATAKEYHDSLFNVNRQEERLKQDLRNLEIEKEQWKREALRQEQEKLEWMKKSEDMAANFEYHAAQWVDRFDGANEDLQARPWLKIPAKITDFMQYCQILAKGFRKRKMKLLM